MRNEHVDVVIVGSGFGGSVAAYRLAAAGLSVVVLERGRAYPPGTFPRSPAEVGGAFWDPKQKIYGMYDVWSFSGCDSVVASGLGGGSLIYANVLLRKDERWFVHGEPLADGGHESWPVTRAELDPHYDAVETMLGATPYPLDHPAYARTPKTIVLRDAAMELGLDWRLPPLGISFAPHPGAEPGLALPIVEPAYGNLHGMPRHTCRLCGECDMGCNDGAKNTLDHTYLSAARYHGADLRTLHEARNIRQRTGGYAVDYVRHDGSAGVRTIDCDRLILAAGTLGTTYLLLRNRSGLRGLSAALGSRFSGNGDLLTFLIRAKDRSGSRVMGASHGPVITSAIRLADRVDDPCGTGRGAYIQDGGYPGFVDWLADCADPRVDVGRAARFIIDRLWARLTRDPNMSAEISRLFGQSRFSSGSLPLLGMGRDVPNGRLRLRGGKLDVQWSPDASADHFNRLRTTMRHIADVLGAEHAGLPTPMGGRTITVHPLGGAPMGRHPAVGVCDPYGEVYGHPGLFIADGAVMPGPVGPNPSLTIAAVADRMSSRLLENRALRTKRSREVDMGATAPTPVSFDEEMAGYIVAGDTHPLTAEAKHRSHRDQVSMRLTIHIDDIDRFLSDPHHLARAEGWVQAACCADRHPVQHGLFNLFAPGDTPHSRVMLYRLWYTDEAGAPHTITGRKDVHDGPVSRIWHDTTTLRVQQSQGHIPPDHDAAVVVTGAGTLRIRLTDFLATLRSIRAEGPHGTATIARFGGFFVGQLWAVYGPG